MSLKIHESISRYLDQKKRTFVTDDFVYTAWNGPHTMYSVSNDLDELLLTLKDCSIRMWHRTMSQLKRNKNPIVACTVLMEYHNYEDILSRNSYYTAMSQLKKVKLLIPTDNKKVYIVNIDYANKLYRPDLEI